jgi:hypothetical protein
MTQSQKMSQTFPLIRLPVLAVALLSALALQGEEPKVDPRYPFRTDFANENLPWYQPKPLEFPPHHSDRRIGGELVTADFIHRTGQFRMTKTGELVDFTMPPYGSIGYLNAEADLRDLPLGTFFLFFLNQDEHGGFTRLATCRDSFSIDAGHSFTNRLDEARLGEGKLLTTKQSIAKNQPDLGKNELLVRDETRVWKGNQQIKLTDLVPGDELLYNLTGKTASNPGWCTELWVGADTHKAVTEQQRKKFTEFTKKRGLPGWVDQTEGNKITVTLFSGDPKSFAGAYMNDIAVGKELGCVVANDELRTWNPPVDREHATLLEIQKTPVNAYGTSGVRLVFTVPYMLEGFRKGRVVRLFGAGWPVKDSFYGESLMGYGYSRLQDSELVELTPKEYPVQFPFRTDYGNENLPWFQLKTGEPPPPFSEHLVLGEIVQADAAARTGQFRTDRTGEIVSFTVIPQGSIKYLNAESSLADLPPGTRCRFSLYQDDHGAFTRASLVSDEYSFLASNAVTYRVETLKLAEGKLHVARQIPEVKNYNGDMEKPQDLGRTELHVTPETRVWKGADQAKLTDLAVGDALLVNLTDELPGAPSRCTDIWIGADTHKLVTDQQSKKLAATSKK